MASTGVLVIYLHLPVHELVDARRHEARRAALGGRRVEAELFPPALGRGLYLLVELLFGFELVGVLRRLELDFEPGRFTQPVRLRPLR
jgi:hypothetical protein